MQERLYSGEAVLARPSVFVLLVASASGAVLNAQPTSSEQSTRYEIAGRVVDADRVPVHGAAIAPMNAGVAGKSVTTGREGQFNLGSFYPGKVSFRFRHLGFESRVIEIEVREHLTALEIILDRVPSELAEVSISAQRGRLHEFYEHKQQRGTFGRFIDQDEIKRRGPSFTSELFRSVPGIQIRASNVTGNTIKIRGCQPTLWVDGQRMPNTELDEVASPGDIAGIEFYASLAGVPPQFLDRTNRACGVIVVWTRVQ